MKGSQPDQIELVLYENNLAKNKEEVIDEKSGYSSLNPEEMALNNEKNHTNEKKGFKEIHNLCGMNYI
jgi:hypothetical protein